MNSNPVVIGVKEEQPTALRFAAEAAMTRGVDLHVIHCIEPLIAGDVVLPVDERGQAEGQAVLDSAEAAIRSFDGAPATTYELSIGAPIGILDDASEKASLLVVGTDEDDWAARLFTDRVTECLAKYVEVPVAIVPEWSRTHHAGTGVYVALDSRSPATGPLRYAFAEANRQPRKVLHVIHAPSAGTPMDEMNDVRREMFEILAGWCDEFPDVDVRSRLVFDETDQACLDATKEAGLFVLGRATRTGIHGILGHPVITEIARRTRCPSVVVPNDWKDH